MNNNPLEWAKSTELDATDVKRFLAIHGKKGVKTLKVLGIHQKYADVLRSEIGSTLLNDLMIKMEKRLDKIIALKAKPEEISEYRAYRELLLEWAGKIEAFEKAKKKIKNLGE